MSGQAAPLTERELADKLFVTRATLTRLRQHYNQHNKSHLGESFTWNADWQNWAKVQLGMALPDKKKLLGISTRLHFPLMALAYGSSPLERMEAILSWCRMKVGRGMLEECEPVVMITTDARDGTPDDVRAFHLGAQVLDISGGTLSRSVQFEASLSQFLGHGAKATVDLPDSHYWRTLHTLRKQSGTGKPPMTYTQFAVLCAVRSKLGQKETCTCTVPEIQRRALGYLTAQEMNTKLPERSDGEKGPLSRQNIRTSLNTLEKWRAIHRYTPFLGKVAMPCWYWVNPVLLKENVAKFAMQTLAKRKPGIRQFTKSKRQEDRELSLKFRAETGPSVGAKGSTGGTG